MTDFCFKGSDALLIIGDSDHNADLFYATGFRAPDSFVFLWTPRSRLVLIGDLELDRARQQAEADEVLALTHYTKLADKHREDGHELPEGRYGGLLVLLEERQLSTLLVAAEFPVEAADLLRSHGLTLQVAPAPLFPQRSVKRPDEIEAITAALQATERAMAGAIEAIRSAEVRADGTLISADDGQVLTSESLRRRVHGILLESDCTAQHTIIACGEDGCDPHQIGKGPLDAGRPVIIDIFPRSDETGYFGDITRTVVKGPPSDEALPRMYDAVERGQQLALESIAAGVDGRDIHRQIESLFADEGFQTGEKDGRMQGYFHGTGHGLGLEIHEAPGIGSRSCILEEGQVVTVEPGLYYAGLGGVRIEDVVVVEDGGCRCLTTFPKYFEV